VTESLVDSYFVLFLVGVTSAAGLALWMRWLGLPFQGLRQALGRTLEWVGICLVCLVVNVGVGFALSVTLRALVPASFLSPYLSTDMTLGLLSALQATTFQWWRHSA